MEKPAPAFSGLPDRLATIATLLVAAIRRDHWEDRVVTFWLARIAGHFEMVVARFARLVAMVEAGRMPKPRAPRTVPLGAEDEAPGPPTRRAARYPGGDAWLIRLLPMMRPHAQAFEAFLADPRTAAFFRLCPPAEKLLAPMRRMLLFDDFFQAPPDGDGCGPDAGEEEAGEEDGAEEDGAEEDGGEPGHPGAVGGFDAAGRAEGGRAGGGAGGGGRMGGPAEDGVAAGRGARAPSWSGAAGVGGCGRPVIRAVRMARRAFPAFRRILPGGGALGGGALGGQPRATVLLLYKNYYPGDGCRGFASSLPRLNRSPPGETPARWRR